MRYSVKSVDREFSPSEAAHISGVSTSLQRDWRRRGVIRSRSEGWHRFALEEVIRMTVMRAFTQSGISIETADGVADLAVLPVMSELARWDDVAIFVGDDLSDEQQERVRSGYIKGVSGDDQFTFVALPETSNSLRAARLQDLRGGELVMGTSGNFYGIVLDHNLLAHRIAELAPLPIITFEIEAFEDNADTTTANVLEFGAPVPLDSSDDQS